MRLTDDRYRRDRLRLELALRFLRHEARTKTIRSWTGLTDDRIRKLHRYLTRRGRPIPRHRGKSPQQIAYFSRSHRIQQETLLLASLLCLIGVMPSGPIAQEGLPGVARGGLLCNAYETYRALVPSSQISFEHTVFLATALARGDQIHLDKCTECGGLVVAERFPMREPRCHYCCAR